MITIGLKEAALTIQFQPVESADPRLLTDSHTQKSASSGESNSFEEKFRAERARLGLMFSPYGQFSGFFSYPAEQTFDFSAAGKTGQKDLFAPERNDQNNNQASTVKPNEPPTTRSTLQLFEGLPLRSSNNQFLQDLLAKTGWLTPNLAARPSFFQAFLDGKLQPRLDLQALVDEIAAKIKLVRGRETTQFTLTLNPAELGEIVLLLTASAGLLSIRIQASDETKKLIDENKVELEQALKKAGITFDFVTVEEANEYV